MSAPATDLVTAADVGTYLNWSSAQATANAAKVARFISSVTASVEFLTGPVVAQPFDEWHDGGFYRIELDHSPVMSVSLITESWGANAVYTLTEQPLDGVSAGNAYGYTLDKRAGSLIRRSVGQRVNFPMGRANVHVEYQAGYCADTASVPAGIAQAALVAIADNWRTQQGGNRPRPGGTESSETTIRGYFLPAEALEMLTPYRERPGIA